jgi:hypothetical protein
MTDVNARYEEMLRAPRPRGEEAIRQREQALDALRAQAQEAQQARDRARTDLASLSRAGRPAPPPEPPGRTEAAPEPQPGPEPSPQTPEAVAGRPEAPRTIRAGDGQEYADTPHMRRLVAEGEALRQGLPPVPEGHVRLWRGNREGEVGRATTFTNSLEGIALPFQKSYGGRLSYVDVPAAELARYENRGAVAPGAEFNLPTELAGRARPVEAPRADPVSRAASAFQEQFPNLETLPTSGTLVGKSRYYRFMLAEGQSPDSVRIDFDRLDGQTGRRVNKSEEERRTEPSVVPFIQEMVRRLHGAGANVEYVAVGGRHRAYERFLREGGYEQVSGPTGEGGELRVWRPREAAPEAPQPSLVERMRQRAQGREVPTPAVQPSEAAFEQLARRFRSGQVVDLKQLGAAKGLTAPEQEFLDRLAVEGQALLEAGGPTMGAQTRERARQMAAAIARKLELPAGMSLVDAIQVGKGEGELRRPGERAVSPEDTASLRRMPRDEQRRRDAALERLHNQIVEEEQRGPISDERWAHFESESRRLAGLDPRLSERPAAPVRREAGPPAGGPEPAPAPPPGEGGAAGGRAQAPQGTAETARAAQGEPAAHAPAAAGSREAAGHELRAAGGRMVESFERHFGKSDSTHPFAPHAVIGGREVMATINPGEGGRPEVVINFHDPAAPEGPEGTGGYTEVSRGLRPGSLRLMRGVRGFARDMSREGLPVGYETESRRAGLYAGALQEAGFTLTRRRPGSSPGMEEFTWSPPARGGEAALPPSILEHARNLHQRGDGLAWEQFLGDLEAVTDKDTAKALKASLGRFSETTRGRSERGHNRQFAADLRRHELAQEIQRHEAARAEAADGPEAAEMVRQGAEDRLGAGEVAPEHPRPGDEAAGPLFGGERRVGQGSLYGTEGGYPSELPQPRLEFGAEQRAVAERRAWEAARAGSPEPPGSEGQPPEQWFGEPGGRVSPEDAAARMLAERLAQGLPQQGTAMGAGAPSPLPPPLREQLKEAGRRFVTRLWDGLRELGGAMAPRTSRLSQSAGEALTRFNASDIYARELTPHLIDRVLGPDARPNDALIVGGVIVETRLRHMREDFLRRGEPEKAREVRTIIGMPLDGDPLKNPFLSEADYQRYRSDPQVREAVERYRSEVVPILERNFRDAQGLEDTDPINSHTQIPGLPVNFKVPQGEVRPGTVSTRRGEPTNPKQRKLPFANEATGAADAYEIGLDALIDHSVRRGTALAAQARMYRSLEAAGLAEWGPRGQPREINGQAARELKEVRPPKGTQEAKAGETSLYLDGRVYDEVRQALQVDAPWKRWWGTGLLSRATLASTVEFAYHGKNLLTQLFKPGVTWNPATLLGTAYKVVSGDRATAERLVELARIGAMKESGSEAGLLLPERYARLDPTAWTSKALDVLGRTMRLVSDDAFTRLARRGLVAGSETNRRDFINQLGQYNQRAQNGLVAWLRQTGVGPFATAGTNFYMQGLRAMAFSPGVKATSFGAAVALRAEMLAKVGAVAGAVVLANYLRWGRVDGDDNTPFGAMKVGEDSQGRTVYLDLLAMTGVTRGMRETGTLALAEGLRPGARARGTEGADIGAQAFGSALHAALHPAMGPSVSFVHTLATGENTLGRRVAPLREQAPHFAAAFLEANPVIAELTRGMRLGKEFEALPTAGRLLGPFGPRVSRQPPGTPHRTITVPDRRR